MTAVASSTRPIRLVSAYKNFAATQPGISHIGLGVTADQLGRVLRRSGIDADTWQCRDGGHLANLLKAEAAQRGAAPDFVNISAVWLPITQLQTLAMTYSRTVFSVTSHSNVGFLYADPGAVKVLREVVDLQIGLGNVRLAGNCQAFAGWAERAWGQPCAWLPNLYDLATMRTAHAREAWSGAGAIRLGLFGAVRPLKNGIAAAAAAVELSRILHADVELWVNSGRGEGPDGGAISSAIAQMATSGAPSVKLVPTPWATWAQFRRTVAHMHLLLQPSFTESFNVVTADGIAEGVASVVGPAIDWAPHAWQADPDDASDLAKTAVFLLRDPYAAVDGQRALSDFVAAGTRQWLTYLGA